MVSAVLSQPVETMKNPTVRTLIASLALAVVAGGPLARLQAQPKRLLVVTATKGFRHSSIPTAKRILKELGESSGAFTVDYVDGGADGKDDAEVREKLSLENLQKYDGVVFANTTGDLAIPDKAGFLAWIKSGKAFIGMHSCSDTFDQTGQSPGYPPFVQMLGGEFRTHHAQAHVQCINMDPRHPATRHLGPTFAVFDEIYLFKHFDRSKVHGLLTLDTHPNTRMPGDFPVSWCKRYGRGRVFYTSLGHREDVWDADPNLKDRQNPTTVSLAYQQHILGGIKWALGLERGSARPQSTRAKLSPEETADGFRPLFDGVDLNGWHLREASGPASWSVQNGMLVNSVPEGGHGTDLVSDEKFLNFTARYEYLIPPHSNSGFYLRGREEVQILDDGDATEPSKTSNGSIYNHTAPSKMVSRKPGQWQTVEATITGDKVTVILNGEKIIDNVTVERPTGGELDNNVNDPGPILLQGDHGAVAFRNLRLKPLP